MLVVSFHRNIFNNFRTNFNQWNEKIGIFPCENILGKHIYNLNKLQFPLNIFLKASFHYKKENNYFGMSKNKAFYYNQNNF